MADNKIEHQRKRRGAENAGCTLHREEPAAVGICGERTSSSPCRWDMVRQPRRRGGRVNCGRPLLFCVPVWAPEDAREENDCFARVTVVHPLGNQPNRARLFATEKMHPDSDVESGWDPESNVRRKPKCMNQRKEREARPADDAQHSRGSARESDTKPARDCPSIHVAKTRGSCAPLFYT